MGIESSAFKMPTVRGGKQERLTEMTRRSEETLSLPEGFSPAPFEPSGGSIEEGDESEERGSDVGDVMAQMQPKVSNRGPMKTGSVNDALKRPSRLAETI
jgi:hypothetical protein